MAGYTNLLERKEEGQDCFVVGEDREGVYGASWERKEIPSGK